MPDQLDVLHYVLIATLLLFALWMAWYANEIHKHVEKVRETYFKLLGALGSAARAIDELAQEDLRTAESMGQHSFSGTAGNARLRGAEVYRNAYVDRYASRIRAHLANYNLATSELLELIGEDPEKFKVRKGS